MAKLAFADWASLTVPTERLMLSINLPLDVLLCPVALAQLEERRQAAQPWRGIHFANTDLRGVALFEEAFHHGLRAAGAMNTYGLHGRIVDREPRLVTRPGARSRTPGWLSAADNATHANRGAIRTCRIEGQFLRAYL